MQCIMFCCNHDMIRYIIFQKYVFSVNNILQIVNDFSLRRLFTWENVKVTLTRSIIT